MAGWVLSLAGIALIAAMFVLVQRSRFVAAIGLLRQPVRLQAVGPFGSATIFL